MCQANRPIRLARLIGRIVSQLKRPVPEWCIFFSSAGTAKPVNTNCPTSWRWSTSNFIVSQSLGASCHSSINREVLPWSSIDGSISTIYRLVSSDAGLSIYNTLPAYCSAVVVLPHHLGPSMSTAPLLANFLASTLSAIRCLYSISAILLIIIGKDTKDYSHFLSWPCFISSVGRVLLPQLAEFCFLNWRYSVYPFW